MEKWFITIKLIYLEIKTAAVGFILVILLVQVEKFRNPGFPTWHLHCEAVQWIHHAKFDQLSHVGWTEGWGLVGEHVKRPSRKLVSVVKKNICNLLTFIATLKCVSSFITQKHMPVQYNKVTTHFSKLFTGFQNLFQVFKSTHFWVYF